MADFNPYTDASLIDYLDDTCTFAVNADGSGGTPSDGQECKYWGGKLGVIAATTTSALGTLAGPTYRASLAGGKPGLVNAAGKGLSLGQPAALTTPLNATNPTVTIIAVFRPTTLGSRWGFAVTKSAPGFGQNLRLGLGTTSSGSDNIVGQIGEAGLPVDLNQFTVATVGYDLGTNRRGCSKIFVNGFGGWGMVGVRPAETTYDIMVGAQGKATAPYTANELLGEMYGVFFFSRYLSPVEVKAAVDQIHAHYSQPLPDAACWHNLVRDCNSISTITNFTSTFDRCIGAHPIYNNGWGGKSGAAQIQWFEEDDAKLLAYLARNGKPTIFDSNEITNDGAGGGPAEAAFENQRRLLTQAGPYASKRIASTAIDRGVTTFSRDWLMRVNGLMRRDYTQFADVLCDFAGTPLDVEDGWASGYLVGDGVHPREPFGMDFFRAATAAAYASAMNAPPSPATSWIMSAAGASGGNAAGGQTSGNIYITPSRGTAAGAVLTFASSNASDVVMSGDASWIGSGSSGTLTWGSSGPNSWMGKAVQVKYGATTGARTLTATVGGVTVASAVVTPAYTGGLYAMVYSTGGTSASNRVNGRESPLIAVKLRTASSSSNGVNAGLAAGVSGTVTITPSAGTVNLKGGSWSWDSSNSEVYFTVTVPPGGTSPITFTGSTTIPGVTVPAIASLYYDDSAEAVVVFAPLATAPHTTKAADSYFGTVRVRGIDSGAVVVTPVDSLGRTIVPSTLTFGPNVTCLPYYLAAGAASGTHSLTTTNNGGLTNPSAVTFVDNAGPYAGNLGFTAINPTSFTVTSPAPTGGTGPFTYLFKYATEAAGGVPGTFNNIAAASSTPSATLTGMTPGARIFVQCTVTDSGSLTSLSPIYDFLMSDLAAGTTSVSAITTTTATATTTGGAGGLGTLSYQAQTAPDVAGSPGAWTNRGSPGASKTATITGLAPSTAGWYRFGTIDSHPLAPGTVYDAAVTATTSASVIDATGTLAIGPIVIQGASASTVFATGVLAIGPIVLAGTASISVPATGTLGIGPIVITTDDGPAQRLPAYIDPRQAVLIA